MKSHIPRKRFGQNFLQDQGIIAAIINTIAPRPEDAFIEIGPGLAALTKPLLDYLPHLDAVEIDRDIVARLERQFPADRLRLHNTDALAFDFGALAASIAPEGKIRLIGNLPYNISTPLLFHLAQYGAVIQDMHFMLQKEVVDRMVAEPDGPDYGRLSIMLQYRFVLDRILDVPPSAFNPPPKVDSAVVRLAPWPELPWPAQDEALLEELVQTAFSQRRKTLHNNLRGIVSDDALEAIGIDPGWRAETLSVAQFVQIANHLNTLGAAQQ